MSNTISNYSDMSVAASTLHTSILNSRNKERFKGILRSMGGNGKIAVNFLVKTDLDGTEQRVGATQLYHAAIAFFEIQGKSVKLTVRMASYQKGRYIEPLQYSRDPKAIQCGERPTSQEFSVVPTSHSLSEIPVEFYSLVDVTHQEWFKRCDLATLPPIATQIVGLIHNSFPYGIPLPRGERVLACTFNVHLINSKSYEHIMLNKMIYGEIVDQHYDAERITPKVSHSWSHSYEKSGSWQYESGKTYLEYREKEAKGEKLPLHVPIDVTLLESRLLQLEIKPDQSNRTLPNISSAIEEVPKE